MKVCYVERGFKPESMELIGRINTIIETFMADGYQLTLRQLYYQLVSRNIIRNQEREYKRLGSIVNDARLAGLVDWMAIEDRTRNLSDVARWHGPEAIIRASADEYRSFKWDRQRYYVEVWVEKEALAGVVERIAVELDIPYFSCRGYVSQSEMWAAAMRLRSREVGRGGRRRQHVLVLHLGDHDPSGIDMTRDIQARLALFGCQDTEILRLALNWAQVQEYRPPPNPAKQTDARYVEYRKQFGEESWELDALEPQVISDLVRDAVLAVLDEDEWKLSVEEEERDRELLQRAAQQWQSDLVPVLEG